MAPPPTETQYDLLFRHLDSISTQIMGLDQRLTSRLDELAKNLDRLDDQYMKIREESGRVDERIKALEKKSDEYKTLIDTSFSKNRETEGKVTKIDLRMAYWSGGGAVIAVLAGKLLPKLGF